VTFSESGLAPGSGGTLPAELFDSVSENLLQNALQKGRLAPGLSITATLRAEDGGFVLTVCDDGEPMSESVARRLFDAPVSSSKTGLGVGLYQAYRFAKERRYALQLTSNEPGRVCFELAPANKT
jgi:sensor histidine kinase regulating citrate/malate metabolism